MRNSKFIMSKLICPKCNGDLNFSIPVKCLSCDLKILLKKQTYYFGDITHDIRPSLKKRDPTDQTYWTRWRKANYEFLKSVLSSVPLHSEILDVGAGLRHFSKLTNKFSTLEIDFYPYPDIDVCVDFTKLVPIRKDSFDVVLLSNVLEHIDEPDILLSNLNQVLRRQGIIIVMVPFLNAIHQSPYDFHRYTKFGLMKLFQKNGFDLRKFTSWGSPLTLASGFMHWAQVNYREHFAYGLRVVHRLNLLLLALFKNMEICLEKWFDFSTNANNTNRNFIGNTPFGYMFVAEKRLRCRF